MGFILDPYRNLKNILKNEGYKIFTEPYKLNIVGLRSKEIKANTFNDEIHVFYYDHSGKPIYTAFPATTDPGTYWLENPMVSKGTAILKGGQYVDSYMMGFHKGDVTRPALVQRLPVTVLRDYDRDNALDFSTTREETGYFGINVHNPSGTIDKKEIGLDSAGCQVLAKNSDYLMFWQLIELHKKYHDNKFTYTLIDFRDKRKNDYKRAITMGLIGGAAIGITAYAVRDKKIDLPFGYRLDRLRFKQAA